MFHFFHGYLCNKEKQNGPISEHYYTKGYIYTSYFTIDLSAYRGCVKMIKYGILFHMLYSALLK